MMSYTQASAFLPNLKLGVPYRRGDNPEAFQRFVCSPSKYIKFEPICLAKGNSKSQNEAFPRLPCSPSKNGRFNPVCLAKGSSKSDNADFSWESLKNAMGGMKQDESVQDWLEKQMLENEFGGDDGDGGRYRGGGGADGSGGEEDEGFLGIIGELLQVILSTLGIIFLYIYLLRGPELTRLARDYIKYLFGWRATIRLRRVMNRWERFCKSLTVTVDDREDWLERAIVVTPTWWHKPDKLADLIESNDD